MILSLSPGAWKTIIEALEEASVAYGERDATEYEEELRALAKALREIGQNTLSGRLLGYRIPGALGQGELDIVIMAVPPK